jgi:hypothetical protein
MALSKRWQWWHRLAHQDVESETQLDKDEWRQEYRKWVHGRVTETQKQAQSWLGVMSTLLGLFSAVVVISHGAAIDQLPAAILRVLVYVFTILAYWLAFAAVVLGARATWGGLSLDPPSTTGEASAQEGSDPQGRLRKWFKWAWNPMPLAMQLPCDTWMEYKNKQLELADDGRKHLHRSRTLGVAGVVLAGILALTVLGFGALGPPQADTSVVVVHDGQVTCGSISVDDGQTRVGDRVISQATQVVVVSDC